jgi:hypothetical protein
MGISSMGCVNGHRTGSTGHASDGVKQLADDVGSGSISSSGSGEHAVSSRSSE